MRCTVKGRRHGEFYLDMTIPIILRKALEAVSTRTRQGYYPGIHCEYVRARGSTSSNWSWTGILTALALQRHPHTVVFGSGFQYLQLRFHMSSLLNRVAVDPHTAVFGSGFQYLQLRFHMSSLLNRVAVMVVVTFRGDLDTL
jgi:hypothetical protein